MRLRISGSKIKWQTKYTQNDRSSEDFSAILSVKGMLCQAYENCE